MMAALPTMLATTDLHAAACPSDRAIYRNVDEHKHVLAFTEGSVGTITLQSGSTKLTYRFVITSSNAFVRESIAIGQTTDEARSDKAIASSVVVALSPTFSVHKGDAAAPFLVIPDLAAGLYYSRGFREKADFLDFLPGYAWKLAGCRRIDKGSR